MKRPRAEHPFLSVRSSPSGKPPGGTDAMTNRTARRDLVNLHHEVLVGGAVGLIAGATFALYFEASLAGFAFGAVLGLATGVTVGALLWIGSADPPDAPIPPVQTSRCPRRRSMH